MNMSHRIEIANAAAPIHSSPALCWQSSSQAVSGSQVSRAISPKG